MVHTVEIDLGGRKITLETGRMAKQANGSVVVRSGDSVVMCTACMAPDPKPNAGFFPLTVDYREYTYSAGKDSRRIHQTRGAALGKRSID
jgi:polyribonucleotide nucleotidyltransferase